MRLVVRRTCLAKQSVLIVSLLFNYLYNVLIICSRGQLGLGELESKEEPVLIEALAGIKVCFAAKTNLN